MAVTIRSLKLKNKPKFFLQMDKKTVFQSGWNGSTKTRRQPFDDPKNARLGALKQFLPQQELSKEITKPLRRAV